MVVRNGVPMHTRVRLWFLLDGLLPPLTLFQEQEWHSQVLPPGASRWSSAPYPGRNRLKCYEKFELPIIFLKFINNGSNYKKTETKQGISHRSVWESTDYKAVLT